MVEFNFEIVVIILLAFAVYYLYDQNMYLKRQIVRHKDSERDTQDTLDFINKDLLNIKRSLLQESSKPVVSAPTSASTSTSTSVPTSASTSASTSAPTSTSTSAPTSTSTSVPVSTGTGTGTSTSVSSFATMDSLRNLGNILGRLPRGTVSRTSSFSMNIPPGISNAVSGGNDQGESENVTDQGDSEPIKSI